MVNFQADANFFNFRTLTFNFLARFKFPLSVAIFAIIHYLSHGGISGADLNQIKTGFVSKIQSLIETYDPLGLTILVYQINFLSADSFVGF